MHDAFIQFMDKWTYAAEPYMRYAPFLLFALVWMCYLAYQSDRKRNGGE